MAEGWGSGSRKTYRHFLQMARGSLMDLEAQWVIAYRLGDLPAHP
ncbi:MAG: four helix bundle protein [Acidobacteria bacterium]|nr:four helix bundle protein [Acidobacteriota bacterium]MDW7984452.1 four helix bundle protein [Acidobacteriota bacterium]